MCHINSLIKWYLFRHNKFIIWNKTFVNRILLPGGYVVRSHMPFMNRPQHRVLGSNRDTLTANHIWSDSWIPYTIHLVWKALLVVWKLRTLYTLKKLTFRPLLTLNALRMTVKSLWSQYYTLPYFLLIFLCPATTSRGILFYSTPSVRHTYTSTASPAYGVYTSQLCPI